MPVQNNAAEMRAGTAFCNAVIGKNAILFPRDAMKFRIARMTHARAANRNPANTNQSQRNPASSRVLESRPSTSPARRMARQKLVHPFERLAASRSAVEDR
jgi:hypothetical protein